MPPSPPDPLTELAAAAAQMHEMFTAYVQAGFNENQALYIIGQMVAAMSSGPR